MKKETWITIGICCVFLVTAGFFYLRPDEKIGAEGRNMGQWEASSEGDAAGTSNPAPADGRTELPSDECTVYICGAVKRPGVYRFCAGSRVCDAVDAAGGLTKKASADAVNQARPLVDGEQITIPRRTGGKGHSGGVSQAGTGTGEKGGLVNINEAGKEELMTLSGIGEAKAQMIIDYRNENGRFSDTGDIMKISGIKEGIYNKIKDSITT